MDNKTIFRIEKDKKNPFAMVDKGVLSDSTISWKSKGILVYLLSKPDDWNVVMSDIINKAKDGRDAVYSGLKELIKAGYIKRTRRRNKEGRLEGHEYIVYEKKQIPTNKKPCMKYMDYLNTEHWQKVRKDALKRSNYSCQLCNSKDSLNVHHRTYERKGEELPSDVIVLCQFCHKKFHDVDVASNE